MRRRDYEQFQSSYVWIRAGSSPTRAHGEGVYGFNPLMSGYGLEVVQRIIRWGKIFRLFAAIQIFITQFSAVFPAKV